MQKNRFENENKFKNNKSDSGSDNTGAAKSFNDGADKASKHNKIRRSNRKLYLALFSLGTAFIIGAGVYSYWQGLRSDPLKAFNTPPPAATTTPAPAERKVTQFVPLTLETTPDPTPPPAQVLGASTINIVLMGLDSNDEREQKGMGYRSDTIAVLVIDVDTPSCTVISVPRDTRARVRKLTSSGKPVGTQYNKINSAFQFGGGPDKNGHENLLHSLSELLFDGLDSEVNLGYYASIDMDSIEKFADAVDGVTITLPYDISGYGKKGEEITLRGEIARKFVRLRHGITGGSDIGRIGRQQLFIRAFAKRVQEMGAKEALPALFSALSSECNTNLSLTQIAVLGDLLSRLKLGEVEFITLPGKCKTIDGRSYYVPDTSKIKELSITLWGN